MISVSACQGEGGCAGGSRLVGAGRLACKTPVGMYRGGAARRFNLPANLVASTGQPHLASFDTYTPSRLVQVILVVCFLIVINRLFGLFDIR